MYSHRAMTKATQTAGKSENWRRDSSLGVALGCGMDDENREQDDDHDDDDEYDDDDYDDYDYTTMSAMASKEREREEDRGKEGVGERWRKCETTKILGLFRNSISVRRPSAERAPLLYS